MKTNFTPRKVKRKAAQKKLQYARAKRGAALTTSALALSGIAVGLMPTPKVAAASSSYSATNQQNFIAMVASHAAKCADENDLYASVMIAQAILESGWGTSSLGSAPNYNLFGIKGNYNGQSVSMTTSEYLNGQWVTIQAAFRKYPSYYESFQDNARLLKNTSFTAGTYFYAGAWKSNTTNYQQATAYLTGRYATDPSYNVKLNNLIATYNLTQYDTPSSGQPTDVDHNNNTGNNTGGSTGSSTSGTAIYYTVKSGEGLWRIAQNNGTTVAQIKSWNNLTSDLIFPNQKLIVGYTASGSNSGNNTNNSNNANNNNNNGGSTGGTTTPTIPSATTHTVAKGDTLWHLAQKYGVTVAQIKSWNNLTSDTIYLNQKLIVGQTAGASTGSNTGGSTGGSTSNNAGNNGGSTSTTPSPSTPSTSAKTYTVKAGDGLWRIAYNHGLTVAQLKSLNNLTSDMIHPGQVLKVSSGTVSNTPNANTGSTSATTNYKVVKGDTLWSIAQKHNTSVAQLKSWNNLSNDTIYLNQTLRVK
ncbi:LysM peptidoglycan-binding domain-containing protein [Enterococcus nangangensis]|uniref:LysM peptidoglycan-binding domain-containing protein n=1 Tax=Enterococcus nangangensis TaxID=2559926 RepID=UPI0010F9727E|nr:LysM peptidoglycan-binding domain-containing protein [Enterococcus nangangensis]